MSNERGSPQLAAPDARPAVGIPALDLRLFGRSVRVVADDAGWLDDLRTVFERLVVQPPGGDSPDVEARAECRDRPRPRLTVRIRAQDLAPRRINARSASHLLRRAHLSLPNAAAAIATERLVLHGAALERDGRAHAIIGRSGAGKTLLAAALLRRGWRLLSDDFVDIAPGPKVMPCAMRLAIDDAGLALLAIHAGAGTPRATAGDGRRLYMIDPARLAQGCAGGPARLSALFVVAGGTDGPRGLQGRTRALRRDRAADREPRSETIAPAEALRELPLHDMGLAGRRFYARAGAAALLQSMRDVHGTLGGLPGGVHRLHAGDLEATADMLDRLWRA